MVRKTPVSGTDSLAPVDDTVVQVVNLGSQFTEELPEDPVEAVGGGGGGVGSLGNGVEVMAKVGLSPLSKVPPTDVPGLECPPKTKRKVWLSVRDLRWFSITPLLPTLPSIVL